MSIKKEHPIHGGTIAVALTFGAAGANPTFVAAGSPLPVNLASDATAALPAGTDRSGSIAVAATAQQLAAANAARKGLRAQNISAGDLWINETGGTAAVDGAGSFKVAAGASFEVATNQAVSIVGATLGQKFSATET